MRQLILSRLVFEASHCFEMMRKLNEPTMLILILSNIKYIKSMFCQLWQAGNVVVVVVVTSIVAFWVQIFICGSFSGKM